MNTRLAIFASGAGSNAQKIIDHFRNSEKVEIAFILCNKPGAGVLEIAQKEAIDHLLIDKEQYKKDGYASFLTEKGIDFIILAGFLLKIPPVLIEAFPNRIINIHPALLPNYGGKGMYGHFVHEAVICNKETESGITIHYVDEQYDHGTTIFQARCAVSPEDTPGTLAQKIHALEHAHFARVIEELINRQAGDRE
ncbi:MAG: phosphoribosylglycinamide formyltransferase [Niabella sp.]